MMFKRYSLDYIHSPYIHKNINKNMLSASVYCKMDIEYEKIMLKAWTRWLNFEYSNNLILFSRISIFAIPFIDILAIHEKLRERKKTKGRALRKICVTDRLKYISGITFDVDGRAPRKNWIMPSKIPPKSLHHVTHKQIATWLMI